MARPPQPRDDRLSRYGGRNYAAFSLQNHVYCVPVDEQEEQRLDELNRILRQLFNGSLVFPPFPENHRDGSEPDVLDCGFGKGAWIDDILQEHDANVTGIDIYLGDGEDDVSNGQQAADAIQEYYRKRWNLNAPFSTDRSNDRLRPDSFDLVHSRCLAEGIKSERWPSYVLELKHLLRPGGWLQMCEMDLVFQSNAGRSVDNTFLLRWRQWYTDAMAKMNLNVRIGRNLGGLMQRAGFEEINTRTFNLPLGDWDPAQARVGNDARETMVRTLQSMSMWPVIMVSRMPEQQYHDLIAGAQRELSEREFRWYITV